MMRRYRPLPSLVAVCVVSLIAAACGSSSPSSTSPSSAHSGDPNSAQAQQDAVNFSDCMRSHGVPSFPDPTTDPGGLKFALSPSSPYAHAPAFQSAVTACQHLLPGGGPHRDVHSQAQIAAFLVFVRCLRSHGFPSFPDPTSTGQLTHAMVAAAGINLHQPAVLQAGDACVGVTHGYITKTDVARFVAGQ
jgi:hypothetical protein